MLENQRKLDESSLSVITDRGVPCIVGECPYCKTGARSLIIADFIPNRANRVESTVYIKCISCQSVYQTKTNSIGKE